MICPSMFLLHIAKIKETVRKEKTNFFILSDFKTYGVKGAVSSILSLSPDVIKINNATYSEVAKLFFLIVGKTGSRSISIYWYILLNL